MSLPKISVCIPVFNGQDFIKEAIDSVLNQSFTDFEIIIVDNHSTDNTVNVVKSYSDSRIKLFINENNIGMIPNWNKTMEYANGKYIKILPADDLIYPNCLELQAKILDEDNEQKISLVGGRRNIINNKGKILFNRGFAKVKQTISGKDAINKVIKSGGNIIGEGGAVMFRKEILKKTGVFNSQIFYVLDLDLWFKILLHGNYAFTPDVVSAFRVSSTSASVEVANKQKEDYFNFIKKIYSEKEFGLTYINYKIGLITTFVLTQLKKLLYKFVIK